MCSHEHVLLLMCVLFLGEDKNNKLMSSEGMEATEQEIQESFDLENDVDDGTGLDLGDTA